MKRLGVMGGTFDPIHHGHLLTAEEALQQFELDEVVFVPTGQPWMKDDRRVTPPEDRYLMVVIATASNPKFSVSRLEIEREGPTFVCGVENPPPGNHTSELRALGHSLSAILRELTGPVVLQYLATDPELGC